MVKKVTITLILVLLVISSLFTFSACDARQDTIVFGTSFSAYVYGSTIGRNQLIGKMINYVDSLDPILSAEKEGSDIYKINHSEVGVAIKCNAITMDNLRIAKIIYDESKGAFDPSVYPLVKLWKFSPDTYVRVTDYIPPTHEEISQTMELVGLDRAFEINFTDSTVTKKIEGAMLDLGGVAKGYAVDKANDFADDKHKVLLNLGGDISVTNGIFTIKIANPDLDQLVQTTVANVELEDGECIATSGGYERYYKGTQKVNDEKIPFFYHHIINPKTGRPADTSYLTIENQKANLLSASIISKDGAIGDATATAVMILGYDKGIELIRQLNVNAILVSKVEGKNTLSITKVGSKFE